jgi:hypothetical protein
MYKQFLWIMLLPVCAFGQVKTVRYTTTVHLKTTPSIAGSAKQVKTVRYTTMVCLKTGPSVVGSIESDSTPPLILVMEEALNGRGAGVKPTSTLVLRGTVTDPSGIRQFMVNQKLVELSSNGAFEYKEKVRAGKNVFELRAVDNKGNVAEKQWTVYRDTPPSPEKRLALVIGNSAYEHSGTLKNAVNDADLMDSTLRQLGFTVWKVTNCSQRQLKEAFMAFGKQLTADAVAVVFYAGHGIEVKRKNYLIPIDAQLQKEADASLECVEMESILEQMAQANTQKNLLILDACRDNPFARSWGRTTGNRSIGLLEPVCDVMVFYAAKPGHKADDGEGKNGLFTSCLVPNLLKPNKNLLEIITMTKEAVCKASKNQQTPSIEGIPFDFLFSY